MEWEDILGGIAFFLLISPLLVLLFATVSPLPKKFKNNADPFKHNKH